MKNISFLVILLLSFNLTPLLSNDLDSNFLKITDSKNREVIIKNEPERIISLAPSITEIIYALGGEKKLVGRTDYCDYPLSVTNISSIGSLWSPNIEKIVALNPDIIIASTHFQKEVLEKLEDLNINVVVFEESGSLNGIYTDIKKIGLVLNKKDQAEDYAKQLESKITKLTEQVKNLEKPSVYYVVAYGDQGDYTAGGDTFISDLIELAGGNNIAKDSIGWGYSLEKIIDKNPDIIICTNKFNTMDGLKMATGYKFLPAIKNGKVYQINTDLIDRQGPRIADGLEALISIIHPEIVIEN
ncbi:MAG: ABC transporter substrate-binding protein [Spirochaetales bacterium]|nr:ABC transporter substrate-binding protein [Spirochaetales bacterium]